MHILHTVPFAFPEVLTRRICFTIKSVCSHGNHFLHPRDLDILFRSKNILRSQSARRLIQKRSINRFFETWFTDLAKLLFHFIYGYLLLVHVIPKLSLCSLQFLYLLFMFTDLVHQICHPRLEPSAFVA